MGVETATEISTKLRLTISLPSMTELTTGYSSSARVQALRKNDMNPNLTPYFFKNYSPSSWMTHGLLFACWWLLACRLPGRSRGERRCFGILSDVELLVDGVLTWVHGSISSNR